MTYRLGLLSDRRVGLICKAVCELIARIILHSALIQKEQSKLEITFFSRAVVQLYKRKLYLLVTRSSKARITVDFEPFFYIIRITAHGIKKLSFARRLIICHSRLNQMPRTVKLMIIPVCKYVLRLLRLIIRIEVSARLLILYYQINYFVNYFLKLRILFLPRNIRRTFNPLCYVRIPENMRLIRHSLFPITSECVKSARFLESVINCPNGCFAKHFLLLLPEAACYFCF